MYKQCKEVLKMTMLIANDIELNFAKVMLNWMIEHDKQCEGLTKLQSAISEYTSTVIKERELLDKIYEYLYTAINENCVGDDKSSIAIEFVERMEARDNSSTIIRDISYLYNIKQHDYPELYTLLNQYIELYY